LTRSLSGHPSKERQATAFGKGTSEENGDDMMERADDTNKKRLQVITDMAGYRITSVSGFWT
jgi:hypothetical protein